jgi:hypothetical protein
VYEIADRPETGRSEGGRFPGGWDLLRSRRPVQIFWCRTTLDEVRFREVQLQDMRFREGMNVTRRLFWCGAGAMLMAGCSAKKKKRGGLNSLPAGARAAKRPKGPQTMGNLLLDSYIEDLGGHSVENRLRAARELAAMGGDAKKALPALEKMAADRNPQLSSAAKEAAAAIRAR